MDLSTVLESLMDRPIRGWPAFTCDAVDERSGRVCSLAAHWQRLPLPDAMTAWTYCDRHRPDGADPIGESTPYAVTRLELRVAIAGRPGDLEASAADALRRAVFALEDIGATVTGIRVVGGTASQAGAGAPPLRLQLAGRPKPVPRAEPFIGSPGPPPWRRWYPWRAVGE